MGIPLYDITVPGFIQTVEAMQHVLQKGLDHCGTHGIDPAEIVETRLYPDMKPFRFQLVSVVTHSTGALESAKAAVFQGPPETPPLDYAGLQHLLADTSAKLKTYTREELDTLQGRGLQFIPSGPNVPFVIEHFLLSFSVPNFYFHAATAYDILRSKGVPLGKRDYLGRLRIKS
jgi:hypothetical protein